MAFGDVFAGFQEAADKHYTNLLSMQYQMRRDAASSLAKMSEDDRYDEPSKAAMRKQALQWMMEDPTKPMKPFDPSKIMVQSPAPPPVNIPGSPTQGAQIPTGAGPGPVPELGDVGASTSLESLQGTRPTSGIDIAPRTIQAPAPPPHPMDQMLPFDAQMQRLHARTIASTKFPPMKVSSVKSMDEDGKVYDYATYAGTNPDTGEYGTWQIKSPEPVAYAPRAAVGAAINSEDEVKLRQAGMSTVLNNPTPEEIQRVNSILPGARLVPTGYGSFYIASQTYRPQSVAGQIVEAPTTPPTGQPLAGSTIAGQATPTLPRTQERTIPLPGGRLGTTSTTSTVQLPGATAAPALPPTGMPTVPGTSGIVTREEAIQEIMKSNQMSRQEAENALNSQLAQSPPTRIAAPTAPPKPGEVRELPGAGRGLSSEQLMQTGQKAEAYQNTVERTVGLLQGFSDPKMRSILERAKLHIVTTPDTGIKLVLGNMATLTPQEAKMASDFVSLSEDVNVLRSMYGATGFRSKEALAVLLGQRGELMENPQVFSGVLKNTLQSIVSQLEPMAQALADNGKPITITAPLATAYKYLNNNDATAARQKALAARYKLPQ